MAKKETCNSCEQFKTMIGGQALLEGIMMRGPEKDAIVCRTPEGLSVQVTERKIPKEGSILKLPLIRGVVNFFDSQLTGIRAIFHSADLLPEEELDGEPGKLDLWLEEKLKDEKSRQYAFGVIACISILMMVGIFMLLPMLIAGLFEPLTDSQLVIHLIEGVIRMGIFAGYLVLCSRMKEMKRVFSYHGAEHKTIRCYEAKLPLTVENVRTQSRMHPRCGTSFLLVVMILSTLVFTVASSLLTALVPALTAIEGSIGYRLLMVAFKLLLLPLVVAFAYELNRWVGRNDNALTRILMAPGIWMQNFTTFEPDDGMIEVAITAVKAVLPEQEGADVW